MSSPTPTFHPFHKLPYELRHLIWSFILPPNRILHFRTNDDLETYLDRRRGLDKHLWLATPASATPPMGLSINRESRAHTLKFYTPLSPPYSNLMVDFENDLWWLEHRNRSLPDYTSHASSSIPDESHGLAASDKARIKNLLIRDPNTRPRDIPLAISFWMKTLGGELNDVRITTQRNAGFDEWANGVDEELGRMGGQRGWYLNAMEEYGDHVVEPKGVKVMCTPSFRRS